MTAVEGLTCDTNERVSGVFDHFANRGGAESPEAAAQGFADGDELVVDPEDGDGVVWVLRPDGTAHTRLGLRHLADDTWIVEYQDSCSGGVGS